MRHLRLFFLLLAFAVMPGSAVAQSQTMEFIYIAHDGSTPVNALCDRLSEVYEFATQDNGTAVVFYLANADEPRIVRVNLDGDNRSEFEELLGELRYKSAHEIFAEVDQKAIIDLFNEVDFINESGRQAFLSFQMTWYVTPTFWTLGYNESLIARTYFTLDLGALPSSYFNMEIWHARDDGLKYDENWPFGTKNLCTNYTFFLLEY